MAKRLLLIVLQFVLFKYASCSPSVLTTETVISSSSEEFSAEILSSKQWNHRDPTVNYGVDVSWPMHHSRVSTNYPWLPHNVDPENNPVPEEYIGMPLQPLGNRQQVFDGTSVDETIKKNYATSINIFSISSFLLLFIFE